MMQNSASSNLINAGLAVLSSALVWVLFKGYRDRKLFAGLQKAGMPMAPWHPIFGHLLVLPEIMKNFPRDLQLQDHLATLAAEYGRKDDGTMYLDLWPFSPPMLILTAPPLAIQASTEYVTKPPGLQRFFQPMTGGSDNMFTLNGAEWKHSRNMFNPGFNAAYILGQMDCIVEETLDYTEILRDHARSKRLVQLDDITLWFTFDIIAAVSINSRLRSQRGYNALASAMRSQIRWQFHDDEFNPLTRWNPMRPIMQTWNSRVMDNYISKELDKRYAEFLAMESAKASGNNPEKSSSWRSVMDLVIDGYMSHQRETNGQVADMLPGDFKRWAQVQIRLFLFAGHDSTSSTICYCFYLLSKHPEALKALREEHDKVFGTDLKQTPNLLKEQPTLINQLPYTLAVIKETLRMFAPASAFRAGSTVPLEHGGKKYPSENFSVWALHNAIHRNPEYWPQADEFLPERFLVEPEHPLYPPKGAWRAFEYGPRNCIGQTLVYLDVKIVLALTVREFDIRDAYDEWDSLHPQMGIKTFKGERAYQISRGGAHPADGFPCRISLRES